MSEKSTVLEVGGREVAITHPDKVVFPRAGHTKLDVARYYASIAGGALRGIAGRPIVNTVRTEGSLFAYPLHLLLVVIISLTFAAGFVSFVIDQWPCFIGVPLCD